MKDKTKKAAASAKVTARTKNILLPKAYQSLSPEAREKVIERITKRRADMPKKYRKLYGRAVNGKASPRDAIKSCCLECTGWKSKEIELCTGVACPLFKYRPYKPKSESSQVAETVISEPIQSQAQAGGYNGRGK